MHESSRGALSPLEPTSQQQQQQQTAPYGRRESITDPLMFRRPSITDLNNLPLPSASSSRRGSMATSTDYDYSSRSPSPSPFKPSSSTDYVRPDAYDPFQRRHSIATAEIPHGSTTRLASSKYRAFRFPATIPEAPGHYSAPSTVARSSMHHHQPQYRPALHHGHRRRSLLTEEGPVIARRASMPVVGYVEPPPPPTSHDKPMRKSETPYSRSPELRVSHKLAERKRRKEMKELFDELRDSLPVEKNLKTSKWEILSKAVEYISLLKRRDFDMENETNALRREVNMLRRERG
ncbi:hypothetical protein K492DRAFT_221109 [Lichtheimia hyalospora FSU 10163]|nr:hypothetical protein K492DRAFT_221109 [Lichtheimia hyalospora FSU 10163]